MPASTPEVVVSYVDEDANSRRTRRCRTRRVVVRLAAAKAAEVCATIVGRDDSSTTDTVVLTCDSMLLLEGELSGKPHTANDGARGDACAAAPASC